MTKFNYEGHDKLGQPVTGSVEAESESKAAQVIRQERGHYAREISIGEVRTMYERPAIGAPVAKEDPVEAKEDVVQPVPVTADVVQPVVPELFMQKVLKEDLERISDVFRQLQEWKVAYRTSAEKSLPLPPGVPEVGGKTWECYEKHFDAIAEYLFKHACLRAMELVVIPPRH